MTNNRERRDFTDLPADQRGHRHGRGHHEGTELLLRGSANFVDGEPSGSADVRGGFDCQMCDSYPDFVYVDAPEGPRLAATHPCPAPDGVLSTTYLFVPSGKLVVTDDLRPVYDVKHLMGVQTGHHPSYGSKVGQALHVQRMAGIGCAYGPVSNTCPALIRTGPDTYVIAQTSTPEDAEEGEEIIEGETLTRIITDLWAYSIADYDDFTARVAVFDFSEFDDGPPDHTVVDVTPGTYRFDLHTTRADCDPHDSPWPQVFADITLVSSPVPGARR